jgi:hypothetical protein
MWRARRNIAIAATEIQMLQAKAIPGRIAKNKDKKIPIIRGLSLLFILHNRHKIYFRNIKIDIFSLGFRINILT